MQSAPINERTPQTEIHMGGSQQQSFPSGFHSFWRQKTRRRLTFVVDCESTSLPADLRPNDSGTFISEWTTQSEIHMGHSQQRCFPSGFHLPSHRQLKCRLTFAVDCESTSLPADLLPNDSVVSTIDHETLPAEASAAHSEHTSASDSFHGGEGCMEHRSYVSLQRQEVHASSSN